MGLFSYDNKFFQTLNQILDFVVLSLIWTVSSLPIITIGACTTALYHTVDKVLRREEGKMWKEYWRVFRRDFKRATGLWLICLLILTVVAVNCFLVFVFTWESSSLQTLLQIVVVFLTTVLLCWMQFWFPYLARFDDTVKQILRNTLAMMMANTGVVLRLLGILVLVVFLENILAQTVPVLTVVMPTAYIVAINRIIEKMFARYIASWENSEKAEA